ncbi:hypothetical protein [Streptomyces soliscabiei]|uniref:hypothetical protein n=1 Tax=Streptomyces soliscabiei TaxID=588897 RepID=UPI0029AE75A5|nr:hypothetical protein [Streptomyces sp. NY05-11A]MDX2677287.1 hypothetical protein [Streptomyces sp. NY05-11A]
MLQSEGDVSHDTLALPASHFDRQPDGGPTRPTPAHRALASLVAAGHLRGPVLTTNFDRLLETALGEAGVRVEVALELEGIAAATQRIAADEAAGAAAAGASADEPLAHSASWLRQALERTAHPGRRTFWLQCGPPTDPALRVMRARDALVVPVTDSDAGLTELARGAAPARRAEPATPVQPPGRPT